VRVADMPDPVYVPVLKGRQGEFKALLDVQEFTLDRILPLIEIVPGPDDEPTTLRQVIDKSVRKLRSWAGCRLLLDAGLLPADVLLGDGIGAVAFAVMRARELVGADATPVVRLNDEPLTYTDAVAIHRDYAGGVALRLGREDLEDDPEDIIAALQDVLRALDVGPREVDLIFDLGAVNGDLAVHAGARFVADLLRTLPTPGEWREIVVTSGAFPADLSFIEAWRLGEPPRYDAQVYDRLQQQRRLPRLPLYGDYTVTHPVLSSGPAFPTPPQLRYTVADRWLTMKGRRNDPRGHEQFYVVCEHIRTHPEFVGAALGQADDRIANTRQYAPGNASTWRQIGTTHHLDYIVRRITTLGEP
jgi:hypothetical protein